MLEIIGFIALAYLVFKFAPAVLEEDASKIFDLKKNMKIDFMEKAVEVKKDWRNKIPAVTHIDNTARVQTVSKSYNPSFYNLIKEFKNQTGVPVVVNTSFNLNGLSQEYLIYY